MITNPNPRRIMDITLSKRSANFNMVFFYPIYLSALRYFSFLANAPQLQTTIREAWPRHTHIYCIDVLISHAPTSCFQFIDKMHQGTNLWPPASPTEVVVYCFFTLS